MTAALARLFEPLALSGGAITIRNRITMSALTRDRSIPTNVPNDVNKLYYAQRAAGGTGLIVTEGTLITQQGTEWEHAPGIWSPEQVSAWKKITDAVHANGSVIFTQLWHLGRVSHPEAPEQIKAGTPVYAPSAISARGGKFRFLPGAPGYVTPTAIDDPRKIIAQYRQAAINAKEAGFDGVELHGANGYLVHQFLDNTSNKRTDEWGGSVENRSRFGLEILKELVDVWGKGRVAIKLSPAGGYNDMGMTLEDTLSTYNYFLQRADTLGLAYIALMRYASKLDLSYDASGTLRATQHDVLASYRPSIKNTSLILNADVSPQEASKLIEEGKIDAAAFGWLFLSNPDLVERLRKGVDLNYNVDVRTLYGGSTPGGEGESEGLERIKKGYSDYEFGNGTGVEVKA